MLNIVMSWIQVVVLDEGVAKSIATVLLLLALSLVAVAANYLSKKIISNYVSKIVNRTKYRWDSIMYKRGVFRRLSHLVPIVIISIGSKLLFPAEDYSGLLLFIYKINFLYFILTCALIVHGLLAAVVDIYQTYKMARLRPINSYIQVLQIIVWVLAAVASVSVVLDRALGGLFLGMGGMMAIILLVFKDSILGLVAGVQITANDMLRLDDWLDMPSRGANGDVVEINLNTVKVRNWDKTITTIPTHLLTSESFINWRGMTESGGRRIKRSISIDMNTIKFSSEQELEAFMKVDLLQDYMGQKLKEMKMSLEADNVDLDALADGKSLTNIGTFRAYLEAYLHAHPKVHQDMTFLVRHLDPGAPGLPIEIYVFSNDQEWANYEAIQAEIFEHVLSVMPTFGLRVFQNPTGADFEKIVR
ncbi:mechanosensitive ion channel family protein [Desulfotalea psychrophila]|uniref:Conserved hypothetical membrane protein n=1 Tax=Desulfotalea psychrophila (strain LSv54 / DSM 12343) TaxID=177439 RepID=Q6ART6_DESPS|nr:mechanosensitive ion channel domain-containing protein [Desulfotalea psychrophila]CAG34939.1 conserved hypothetical membrane protein [Desulfotalea psychrophila LSv54]